jgi:hypothetical protein
MITITKRTSYDYINFTAAFYLIFVMVLGLVVLTYPSLLVLMIWGLTITIILLVAFLFAWIKNKGLYLYYVLSMNVCAIIILFAYQSISGANFIVVPFILIIPWVVYVFYILKIFIDPNNQKTQFPQSAKILNLIIASFCSIGYLLIIVIGYVST